LFGALFQRALQRAGRLVVGGEQVVEALAQLRIVAAFPVQEGGAVLRGGQVEDGVEQGFHATRIERHRERLPRVGFPDERNPEPRSLKQ